MSGRLRFLLFGLANILLLIGGLLPLLAITYAAPRYSRRLAVFWARTLLKVSGFQVKIRGAEHIPGQPVLIAANHTSFFDILLTLGYLPLNFNFVMKKELFKIPLFGRAVKTLGYFPLDRQNAHSAAHSLQELARFLRGGGNVLIFPEGTRNKTAGTAAALLPFKSGMARVAQQAQVAVLPVALDCAAVRQRPWRPGGVLTLTICPASAPPRSDDKTELAKLSAAVRDSLLKILK